MPNFKNKAGYKSWLAYGHLHGVMNGEGREKVTIKGKPHKVQHEMKRVTPRKPHQK